MSHPCEGAPHWQSLTFVCMYSSRNTESESESTIRGRTFSYLEEIAKRYKTEWNVSIDWAKAIWDSS